MCKLPIAGESARRLTPPAAEKDTLLTMVAVGNSAQIQALLLRRFRGDTAVPAGRALEADRRDDRDQEDQ